MDNKNLNVIIIGGGIGGLCLAQGLKKAGIKFTVFERNKDNDTWLEGYRIHVNPIGSSALNECLPTNLWNAFLAGTGDEKDGFAFMTEQLKELVFIEADMMIGYTKDPAKSQYAASRKMLRYVLQAGIEENIIYGKTFLQYEQTSNGNVRAFFEDGISVTGDVLVGADGSNSKVRKQLLPNAKRGLTDAVAVAGRTMLNENTRNWLPNSLNSRMNVIMPLKKYFLFCAPFDHKIKNENSAEEIEQAAIKAGINPNTFFDSKENYILWAFIAHKKEFVTELRNQKSDLQNSVLKKISNWHSDIKRVLKEADPKSLTLLPFKVMLPIENWKATNVTILGDAVHNMPPLYGMGANMAMHDACLLCRQIIEANSYKKTLSQSLEMFQDKMLKDGFEALNLSMKYTRQAISYNWINRLKSYLWFMICNAIPAIKQYTFGKRWAKE
jgi:2-polyprenyl-6-methoxyphenol hydroxylase-like FAD-dependent oxidoreductase